jgi:hypothetical protein
MTNLTRHRVVLMNYPPDSQLVQTIGSVKCKVHVGFDVSSSTKKYEHKIIHEHDFVEDSKGDNSLVCCITCGSYYCNLCGNLLEKKAIPSVLTDLA